MKIQLKEPVYMTKPVDEVEITSINVDLESETIRVVVGVPPASRVYNLRLSARMKAEMTKAITAAVHEDAASLVTPSSE